MTNQKCENCIHFDMCAELIAHYHKVEKGMVIPFMCDEDNEKLNCNHYKDKSLLVELPCKVGDIVWEIRYGIHYNKMLSIPYIATSRVISLHIEKEVIIETENANYYIEHIGKRLFFTKEDAEAKLKEIEGK